MLQTEHRIVQQVLEAQKDPKAADALIEQYLAFIRSEAVKTAGRGEQLEDALSIAMFAFYEAILSYESGRGAFLTHAARTIRSRLIDDHRKQRRHWGIISLQTPVGEKEDGVLEDTLTDGGDHAEDTIRRQASQQEIAEFGRQLEEYGLSFSAVADNSPRQQRTLDACHRVLQYARNHPQLLDQLVERKRLPMAKLSAGSGVDKKTMERHRAYLVAILLAFTNGYEIIRGHLCQIRPEKGGAGR